MASSAVLLFLPNLHNPLKTHTTFSPDANSRTTTFRPLLTVSASSCALQALIFDCDGVSLESKHLHRQTYNDAFAHFNVHCPSSSSLGPLNWSPEIYDELQNLIGDEKPKMRRFFKENWRVLILGLDVCEGIIPEVYFSGLFLVVFRTLVR